MMFVYIGNEELNDGRFMILAGGDYKHLNEQVIILPNVRRRTLQAHALVVLTTRQVEVSPHIESIIKVKQWSPEATKEPGDDVVTPSRITPPVLRFSSGTPKQRRSLKLFTCARCDLKYTNKPALEAHMKETHAGQS